MTPRTIPRTIPRNGRQHRSVDRRRSLCTGLALAAAAATLAACGGSATTATPATNLPPATATASGSTAVGDQVLPIASDPIANTSTNAVLAIDSVLVENNVDATTGKDADDHLEIAVTNSAATALSGFEVYYTYDDTTDDVTESYYTRLPDTFTVAAGASRVIHFDNTGAPDHFADNQYSLYHTSLNALDVTVEVSATDAAPQTMTVQKDPGGDEVAD